jgi:hypothetical protein
LSANEAGADEKAKWQKELEEARVQVDAADQDLAVVIVQKPDTYFDEDDEADEYLQVVIVNGGDADADEEGLDVAIVNTHTQSIDDDDGIPIVFVRSDSDEGVDSSSRGSDDEGGGDATSTTTTTTIDPPPSTTTATIDPPARVEGGGEEKPFQFRDAATTALVLKTEDTLKRLDDAMQLLTDSVDSL